METNKKGKVYLIGAGPGDVGLLTLKAAELLKTAHVVVFDRLVGQDILKLINNNALLIDVGKTAGNHPVPQHRINEVLVEQASQGKIVARLKGGDCFVFGRGGEEAERLVQAGIPFEIVPGITSAIAVPAYAGIPVTHRDLATSFHVITGHEREGKDGGIDFEPLAKLNGTLVFLMGVGNLQHIVQSLMAHGKSPQTPVAMIERGTTYAQRSISGDLQSIVQIATEANIQSPAIIVVGEVVTLKDRLSWREKLPLWGKRIVVTRARTQASDMVQRLSQLGAQVVEIPTVRITPTNQALPMDTLSQSQWLVFTSVNGVNIFFDKLKQEKRDIRALVGLKIAVVGTVTAQAVTDRGLCVDYMPEIFTAKQLVQGLRERLTADDRVLCILGNLAERCDIPNATRFDAYTTTPEAFDLTAEMLQTTHYLIFASSSAVHHFVQRVQAVGLPMPTATTVCIGPVTADTAKKAGLTTVTADTHTIDGVLQKLMALEGKG